MTPMRDLLDRLGRPGATANAAAEAARLAADDAVADALAARVAARDGSPADAGDGAAEELRRDARPSRARRGLSS